MKRVLAVPFEVLGFVLLIGVVLLATLHEVVDTLAEELRE